MPPRAPAGFALAILLLAFGGFWWTQTRGLISSNDGSNVALARALARGDACLGPDGSLTLWVDHARAQGQDCSDRPPGAAMLAIPAVLAARGLDRRWFNESRARLRTGPSSVDAVIVRPATQRYIETYGARRRKGPGESVDLIALQGTAYAIGIHTVSLGVVGLVLLWKWLAALGMDTQGRWIAVLALGGASLWGPYATALFGHETAGVAVLTAALSFARARSSSERGASLRSGLGGLALGWACITDYTLVLVAVPMIAVFVPPRRWGWVAMGLAVPFALAAAYHDAAFGAWWRIGYDRQSNFAFARERAATFRGDPLKGWWTLWGWGAGAGVAAQAPLMLLGFAGSFVARWRRWALIWVPWLLLLAFHRTPGGGAGEDHRYLLASMPVWAAGVGALWGHRTRFSKTTAICLGMVVCALFLVSGALTWHHFWSWRGDG